ncbi:MAG: MFS transporter [Burkholderiales bacterium]|nr:MFS transporter [Burkholderiales bacterium]
MCGAEICTMTGFASYTTLIPVLQREWHLSNSEAGLIGGIFYAGFLAATPVLTSLTDRMDSRRVYVGACAVWFTGAAGFALLAEGLLTAMLFQAVLGVGFAGTYMPGLKMLSDQMEGEAQARAVGFYAACFGIGSSTSILASGALATAYGWQWAFALGAFGPVAAAALVASFMPAGRVRPREARAAALLDFRPVFANRRALPFIAGCTVHGYELFGQRSWMVAFLVYCASLTPDGTALAGVATLAALVNLCGPAGSVAGNELAIRHGRERVILTVMCASGVMCCGIGWLAGLPLAVVFAVMCLHYSLMLGDSAALMSGLIAATPPELRGATMAAYSFIGFSGALLAPFAFGVVLDLAGGNRSTTAWWLAFASIGVFGAAAPLARWLYLRRQARSRESTEEREPRG